MTGTSETLLLPDPPDKNNSAAHFTLKASEYNIPETLKNKPSRHRASPPTSTFLARLLVTPGTFETTTRAAYLRLSPNWKSPLPRSQMLATSRNFLTTGELRNPDLLLFFFFLLCLPRVRGLINRDGHNIR